MVEVLNTSATDSAMTGGLADVAAAVLTVEAVPNFLGLETSYLKVYLLRSFRYLIMRLSEGSENDTARAMHTCTPATTP